MKEFYNIISVFKNKTFLFSGSIIGYICNTANYKYYLVANSKPYYGFVLGQSSIDRVMDDTFYVEVEFISEISEYFNTEVAWVSEQGILW